MSSNMSRSSIYYELNGRIKFSDLRISDWQAIYHISTFWATHVSDSVAISWSLRADDIVVWFKDDNDGNFFTHDGIRVSDEKEREKMKKWFLEHTTSR